MEELLSSVDPTSLMPNTYRGLSYSVHTIRNQSATVSMSLNKFANSEVELCRVGSMNAPVSSRNPVYNFLCC